jgi:hypothetical protein
MSDSGHITPEHHEGKLFIEQPAGNSEQLSNSS